MSSEAPRPSPADPPEEPVDISPFLERTMPIGNLGSITCNPGRCAVNPEWTLLAAPQDRGSVRLYDLATGEAFPPLEGGFKVGTLTYAYADRAPPAYFGFSTDGRTLVWTWGKKIVVWDVASRQVLVRRAISGSSRGLSFSLLGGNVHQKVAVAFPAPHRRGPGDGPRAPTAGGWRTSTGTTISRSRTPPPPRPLASARSRRTALRKRHYPSRSRKLKAFPEGSRIGTREA